MAVQFQSLEGRTLFSSLGGGIGSIGDITKLGGLGSLTKLLSGFGGKSGLSSSFLSSYAKDLTAASGKAPSGKSLSSFNATSASAFADGKFSTKEIAGLESSYGSVLKSQGLSSSLSKSLNGDFSTLLGSKLSATQKDSFLGSFAGAAGNFGKIKL